MRKKTPVSQTGVPLILNFFPFSNLSFVRRHETPADPVFHGVIMDLRGIEPLSESLSLAASPITVADLTFPLPYARRQAEGFSSFIIHLPGQSLPDKVSHRIDARFPTCECVGADEQLTLLTRNYR